MNDVRNLEFVPVTCPGCGLRTDLPLMRDEVESWRSGVPAERAFPGLSEAERIWVTTGTCTDCTRSGS